MMSLQRCEARRNISIRAVKTSKRRFWFHRRGKSLCRGTYHRRCSSRTRTRNDSSWTKQSRWGKRR